MFHGQVLEIFQEFESSCILLVIIGFTFFTFGRVGKLNHTACFLFISDFSSEVILCEGSTLVTFLMNLYLPFEWK